MRIAEGACILIAAAIFATLTLPSGALIPVAEDESEVSANVLPLDDAYIFVRFARQMARGRFLEWTDGQPSSGATSLSYVALLLPGQWWSDEVTAWSRWSQWVGLLTMWLLGLAALCLFRAMEFPAPWPLLGALTTTLSGPVGWGALAGMESAWNASAVLLACTCTIRLIRQEQPSSEARPFLLFVASTAVLPLFRPENVLLAALACASILVSRVWRGRRKWAPLVLVPSVMMALLNWGLTGEAKPAGAIVKAITEYAFLDVGLLATVYSFNLTTRVLPAYLGDVGRVLPAPVGWIMLAAGLAIPVAVGLQRFRSSATLRMIAVPTLAWWSLFLAAPLSSMIHWQYMRHHHAALILAWVVVIAVSVVGFERLSARFGWSPRVRWSGMAVPVLLLFLAPFWGQAYEQAQDDILRRHGPAGEWLERQQPKQVLLLNDAGYLQVFHDGPAIDIMGLGTPSLGRPHRHGAGSSVEALARQAELPSIAAVNRDVFPLEELLGELILPEPTEHSGTVLAEVRAELLAGTRLEGRGVDFAHLEDEERYAVRWTVEPSALEPSYAVILAEDETNRTLHGCRPVAERIEWRTPREVVRSRVLVFAPPTQGVELAIRGVGDTVLARTLIAARGWKFVEFETGGATTVVLERLSGGVPCVESVAFE